MDTNVKHATPSRLGRGAALGAGAGVVASVAMGLYAMVASLVKDTGFFTPLHHIATVIVAPDDLMSSMMSGMTGDGAWEVAPGTALLGLAVHVMTGAGYGAAFGAIASRLRSAGAAVLAGLGAVWGGLVFVISSWVGLPLAAAVFGVSDLAEGGMAGMNPIADMPEMAGWGTFLAEHVLFGVVTGLLVAAGLRPGRRHPRQ
ncbi:hypothetical protein KUV85_08480 [Nocardioides panacisoli]|uniref:hypothetical protein n=1 Tax=Nocardioides panacisoli TaxID=627624 RepID=UPI001C63866D|nr:hypothetical protein [Nocardioides panacisoli]QYJ05700.1 hypothetical protein KUV85_08480 [Nocardioides panacisoli]